MSTHKYTLKQNVECLNERPGRANVVCPNVKYGTAECIMSGY